MNIEVLLNIIKKKKNNKNKKRQNFYYKTTLVIQNRKNNINLNLKLFGNGSIQITGAKNISSVFWCIYKIFKLICNTEKNFNIKLYEKSTNDDINLSDIENFKIAMINCVAKFDYKINRNILYKKLSKDGYNVLCDSSRHAGVNLKYYNLNNKNEINNSKYINRYVSMLIFEKGSILFSGATNYKDIMICYKFLNLYLINNYLNNQNEKLLSK